MRRRDLFTISVFAALALSVLVGWFRASSDAEHLAVPGPLELDAVVLEARTEVLEGRVLTASGEPAPDVLVETRSEGEPCWDYSDATGSFRLTGLAPGDHRVVAVPPGLPPSAHAVSVPSAEAVELRLTAAPDPPPVLEDVSLSDFTGFLGPRGNTLRAGYEIILRPLDDGWLSGRVVRRTSTASDGRFSVQSLIHGTYDVVVLPPWATGSDGPALHEVRLTHPADSAFLLLNPRTGSLSGQLLDEGREPVEGVLVQIRPTDNPTAVFRPSHTGADGRFLIEDIPPARYAVTAYYAGTPYTRELTVEPDLSATVDFGPLTLP